MCSTGSPQTDKPAIDSTTETYSISLLNLIYATKKALVNFCFITSSSSSIWQEKNLFVLFKLVDHNLPLSFKLPLSLSFFIYLYINKHKVLT